MRARPSSPWVLLAGLLAAAAAAQEPAPVRESAEVSLVEVPVRVIGRDGHPVRGLTAASFSVEDEGRPQTIVGFDAIDLADKTDPAAGPLPPAARRRFLFFFDFSFSRPKAIVAARRAAREFVLTGMTDRDLAAVATYSVERGVRLLVTFSSDRVQLSRAIETLGLDTFEERTDPLAFAYEQASGVGVPGIPTSRPTGGHADAAGLADSLQALSIVHKMRDDEYSRGRVRHLFQSFRDLSLALDAVEGRKDVIYLSEGFRGRFLVGTQDTEEERQYLLHGEVWKVDSDKRFGSTPLRQELSEVGELFRRSDCVVHAVDIGGIRAEGDPREDGSGVGPRENENALYEIAQGSGGDVFRNANDLGADLARLVAETEVVYVLAFKPDRSGGDGRYHPLKVKVSTAGARVLARAGYYERHGLRQLSPLERRLLAADVIANEIPFDDVPARVLAVPFAGEGGIARVPVLLEVPGAPLVAGDRGEKLTVELYAYAVDREGRLADFFTRTIGADLAKNRDRLSTGGVRYYAQLRLPPGAYRLRTLVRNTATGRMGFSVTPVDVPAFSPAEPFLLPPLFLDGAASWISVAGGSGGGAEAAAAASSNPFAQLPSEGMAPAALPSVAPGAASRLCLVAYHFDGGEKNELGLGSQVLAADGRPMESVKLAVLGSTAPEARRKADAARLVSRSVGPRSGTLRAAGVPAGRQGRPDAAGDGSVPGALSPGAVVLLFAASAAAAPAQDAPPPAARDRIVAGLHARAAFALPGSTEAIRVAGELERLGAAYLAEGDTGRASELLAEAYALDEGSGLILAELTLCELRAGDPESARFYLRLAEQNITRAPPEIYAVLGDAYLSLHRLPDAVSAWEEFLRFGGTDPAVLSRLARAREELAVSRGQRSLEFEHFTVFADPGVPPELLRSAGEALETVSAAQAPLLGPPLATRQVAILYATRAYFSLVSVPDWSSGLYDGKIRIGVEPGEVPEALAAVLAHELAHARVREACGGRAPLWIHEGLAQWCSGRRATWRETRETLHGAVAASAGALDRTFSRRLSRSAARASYTQALSLVEHLLALRGEGAVACLLSRLSQGGSFEDALRIETGLTEDELFASWRKWVGL
jgi:VWFA-related protein